MSRRAIFLSYASADVEAARWIGERLKVAGLEVWFDRSELRGGDAWDQQIRKQIRECALFLPVISRNTNARLEGYFRREWKLAVDRTQDMAQELAFLVPVVIDDVRDEEASVPDKFRDVQWTRVEAGKISLEFTARLKTLLEQETSPRPHAPDAPKHDPRIPRDKSLAVLAFVNLSRDPENEYFSDGISEELLNLLARLPGLRVTARTSSFHFKGKNTPIPEIARKLDVGYVVEGSVRRSGDRVRITAQLIDATGFHVWSETYERELRDIFAVQDQVARQIASNCQVTVDAPALAQAVNPAMHRLVLQGRHFWNQFTEDGLAQAESAFAQALELEPRSALAFAGLATVWCRRSILSGESPTHAAGMFAQAHHCACEALALNPGLAEPNAVLGVVALYRGQLAEATGAFERALRINPNSDLSHVYHARLLARQGRSDLAVAAVERAQRLSPLVAGFTGHRATALLNCHRFDEAFDHLQKAEHLAAESSWTRALMALTLVQLGRADAAQAKARSALNRSLDPTWPKGMAALTDGLAAWALADAGARNEAESVVHRLLQGQVSRRYTAGFALAALGRLSDALACFAELPQWSVDQFFFLAGKDERVPQADGFAARLETLGATEAFETYRAVCRQ